MQDELTVKVVDAIKYFKRQICSAWWRQAQERREKVLVPGSESLRIRADRRRLRPRTKRPPDSRHHDKRQAEAENMARRGGLSD